MTVIDFTAKKEIFDDRKQKRQAAFDAAYAEAYREVDVYLGCHENYQKVRAEDEKSRVVKSVVRGALDLAVFDPAVVVDYDLARDLLRKVSSYCPCDALGKELNSWAVMIAHVKDGSYIYAHEEIEKFFTRCLLQAQDPARQAYWGEQLESFWGRFMDPTNSTDRGAFWKNPHKGYWRFFQNTLGLIQKAGPQGVDRNAYSFAELPPKASSLLCQLETMATRFMKKYVTALQGDVEAVVVEQPNLFIAYEFLVEILNDPAHSADVHKTAQAGLDGVLAGHRHLRNVPQVVDYLEVFFKNTAETHEQRAAYPVVRAHADEVRGWREAGEALESELRKRATHRMAHGGKIRVVHQGSNLNSSKGPR